MAARGNIKGITIEFDGKTTKLGKALKDIKTKAGDTEAALRDVNKLLKFNPTNTELLAQKQTILKKRVEETEEKLKQLKKAQETLDANGVDKNSAQYQELRREIIETESKLERFEKTANEVGDIKLEALKSQFQQVGAKVQEVGENIKAFGENMTKYVTVPLTALGAGITKSFTDVDAGLDIIITKTGANAAQMEEFEAIYNRMAASIPADFETIGTAIGEVNTRFGVYGEQLEELSTLFVQFAEINDTDVNDAIDTTSKIMAAYGLTIDEVSGLLDTMNTVGQNTGISMSTLGQSMITYQGSLQELGLTYEQAAFFLGEMEVSGVELSDVMGALQKAYINAASEGKTLTDALTEMQGVLDSNATDQEKYNAVAELFGTKSAPKLINALESGALSFDEFGEAGQTNLNSVADTFAATLDPIDEFKTTLNQLQIVGADIGNTLFDILQPALQTIADVLRDIKDFWDGLSPEAQDAIVKALLLAAALGPVLTAVGGLVSGIGGLIAKIGLLSPGLLALMASAAPIVGIIVAIGAALVVLITHWEEISAVVDEVVYGMIIPALESLWQGFSDAFDTVVNTVSSAVETVRSTITDGLNSAYNTVSSVLGDIKSTFTDIWEDAKSIVSNAIEKIKGFMDFNWSLPHIKLPHFSVSGSANPLDWIKNGVPHISVDWYKTGGIFSNPSIIGVGEAGSEAVLPLDDFYRYMDRNFSGGGATINVTINAAPGQDVNAIANAVMRKMQREIDNKRLTFA